MLVKVRSQRAVLKKINQRNRQFWLEQSALLDRRMQDEGLYKIAMDTLSREESRMIPVKNRESLEEALAHAEYLKTIFQSTFSGKGGKAAKTDALQRLIIEIVRTQPDINTHRLLRKIWKMAEDGHEVVRDVVQNSDLLPDQAEMIHFRDNERDKTSPVSGLKDRLCRAKKKILSR
jgi:hypothetical protein